MRFDFVQNIINICRGKFLYLHEIASRYEMLQQRKFFKNFILGSSHAMFYQANEKELNLATPSQDLYYSYCLYEKYGQKAENIILTYSVFSKGLCLIKTNEIELCILLKEFFEIDYQFKDFAKKKKLYLLEPFYRIYINKYLKNPKSLRLRVAKDGEVQSMNFDSYIQERAKKHYKNYQRKLSQLVYIKKFIEKTKENNQNLILILPPVKKIYKETLPDGKEIFQHLYEICNKYEHVQICDFYNSNSFREEDFVDGDHLNANGKLKLTEMVRAKI